MSMDERGVVMSTTKDGGARLLVAGELDASAVDRLRALLEDATARGAPVRVDLSRASVLPLGLLRVLAAAHRSAAGGALVVVDPSPAALRALRTSGLHRVLQVESPPAPTVRASRPRARRRSASAGAEPA